jgi:membrane protein required for beta-lactamase induction
MNTKPRYQVSTRTSQVSKIREPHMVVDTSTNQIVDEYASKKAAQMHAAQLNAEASK